MVNARTICDFVDGEWVAMPTGRVSPVYNPSLGEVIAEVSVDGNAETISNAVQAANVAFPNWSKTPAVERARILFRYRQLLEEHFDEISQIISLEHGKTLGESKAELQRGMECVEFACSGPELMKGENLDHIARDIHCEVVRYPLGVCVGITPFNFPVMIAMWMFPLALVSGNTFILKPSEKVPLSAMRIIELLHEAGLPKGVMNLVHGGKPVVDSLITHPDVEAVSFVGSSSVAQSIYETASLNNKRVQANGGAKNHVIIMPDADPAKAVGGIIGGAFGCAGERCMAIASAIVVGKAADTILPDLVGAAKGLKVGRTDIASIAQMGPLVTSTHRDQVSTMISNALSEGGTSLCDGRTVSVEDAPNGFFLGPTIVDHITPGMELGQKEVFGPVLSVMRADSLQAAVDLANNSPYGNGAVVFTQSGGIAREFSRRVEAGMVGINVGVPAPMAMFPFSGWKSSYFGDLHIQGRDGLRFYTREKTITSRWFGDSDVWRKT